LGAIDNMRILVETPEPGGPLLAASAFGFLMWARRRSLTKAPDRPEDTSSSDTAL
jgi:hypothetical protein